MKLELIKETKLGDKSWYELRANDKFVTGSYTLEKVEQAYDNIKAGGDPFITKEILRSEQIVVPLEETN